MSPTAEQLVDAVISCAPDHVPGTRPIHFSGIGVKGNFVASPTARHYSKAEHFQGGKVPVTVRFSNGTGSPERHDGWPDVRGMATRFHLTDHVDTDLIAMTLSVFFTPTTESFVDFCKFAQPKPVERASWLQKMISRLKLIPPAPDPMPGETENPSAGVLEFANRNRFAKPAIYRFGTLGAPVSYARASYDAVHTFVVVDHEGQRRHVRFNWLPVAGVLKTDPDIPPVDDYLDDELRQRINDWPARFLLIMTIGELGDAFDDPTRAWPKKRVKINMGTLTLTEVPDDQNAVNRDIAFNPCRLTPGIELSDDPILRARLGVYEESRKRRRGTACPFHNGAQP